MSLSPDPSIALFLFPISIYWEDNVYPGFSKQDRELMIKNYLDGVHLKTMALNAPDGKHVYLYRLDRPILKELKQKYSTKAWYDKGLKEYARLVMQSEKIYTKATMPKLNYTVSLDGVLEDGEELTIAFQTADSTATASYDYAPTTQSVTFTKDSMTQTIEVPIYEDNYKKMGGVVNNVDFRYREVV